MRLLNSNVIVRSSLVLLASVLIGLPTFAQSYQNPFSWGNRGGIFEPLMAPAPTKKVSDKAKLAQLDLLLKNVQDNQQYIKEDDMLISVSQLREMRAQIINKSNRRKNKNGITLESVTGYTEDGHYAKWPNGIVYYTFNSNVNSAKQATFKNACREWEAVANVHFVPWNGDSSPTTTQKSYIKVRVDSTNSTVCGKIAPFVNNQYIGQEFNIDTWDESFRIVHELGHTLGLMHEQQRTDRDNFVQIINSNLDIDTNSDTYAADYLMATSNNSQNRTQYDYESLMHYGEKSHSKNGNRTIIPVAPFAIDAFDSAMGQRDHLSELDKAGIVLIYGPAYSALSVTVKANGTAQTLQNFAYAPPNSLNFLLQFQNTTYNGTSPGGDGGYVSVGAYPTQWHGVASSIGTDGKNRILWRYLAPVGASETNNRRASLWTYTAPDSSGGGSLTGTLHNAYEYGPYPDWTCIDLSTRADNKSMLLWRRSDGKISVWPVDATGFYDGINAPAVEYGPFKEWYAQAIASGPDNKSCILWNGFTEQVSLWLLGTTGALESSTNNATGTVYPTLPSSTPPVPSSARAVGFRGKDVAIAPNGEIYVVSTHEDGRILLNVYSLTVSSGLNAPVRTNIFGPHADWRVSSITVGSDGKVRLLWNKLNIGTGSNRVSIWVISPATLALESSTEYPW